MPAKQLKDTTMDKANRTIISVKLPNNTIKTTSELVNDIMGRNPEKRLQFIKEKVESSEILYIE
jgi:topoisomerase-4 subunit B